MSELHIDVLESFELLNQSLIQLCNAIKNEPELISWCQIFEPFSTSFVATDTRTQICEVLSQLHYLDNQAPREIIICAGFIGASSPTIKLATEVNERKDAFKRNILNLKKSMNIQLKHLGLHRVHLKQCYRKIPILDKIPNKISWTWAHTRSIKRITIRQAQKLLEKKGNDLGIEMQMQKLNKLSEHESLAIVQELAPHLRANLVFNENKCITRSMIKGPVPVFFPYEQNQKMPEFKIPLERQFKNLERTIRNDVKLDPIPFLPAIRAHRYIS